MLPRKFSAVLLAAALTLSGATVAVQTVPAAADTKDDLIKEREERAERREKLQSELEGVDTDLSTVYLKLEDTRANLATAETELATAEAQLAGALREQENIAGRLTAAEAEKERIGEEISETTTKIDETEEALVEVVRTSYRSGGANLGSLTDLYEIGVGDGSVDALAARDAAVRSQTRVLDQLGELNAKNRNANARQETVTGLIADLKDDADAAVVDAENARTAKEQKTEEIAGLKTSQESLAGELENRKDTIVADRAANDAADKELQDQIAAIVKEEKRKAAEEKRKEEERRKAAEEERKRKEAEAKRKAAAEEKRQQEEYERKAAAAAKQNKPAPAKPKPVKPAPVAPAPAPAKTQKPAAGAAIIPPVPRPLYVTSSWGYRVYPITGGWFMHNGVDLRSTCGQAQVAAAAGTVTATKAARGNGTHGNQVIVNHGLIGGVSYITVYNHLSGFAVSPGQRVKQGQAIGYTGATGMVTGCHVHFEVWKNGATVDPMGLPGF